MKKKMVFVKDASDLCHHHTDMDYECDRTFGFSFSLWEKCFNFMFILFITLQYPIPVYIYIFILSLFARSTYNSCFAHVPLRKVPSLMKNCSFLWHWKGNYLIPNYRSNRVCWFSEFMIRYWAMFVMILRFLNGVGFTIVLVFP